MVVSGAFLLGLLLNNHTLVSVDRTLCFLVSCVLNSDAFTSYLL